MKTHNPLEVAAGLMGSEVLLSDRCCGEAGTLGTSRPDIANQLRFRKQEELQRGVHQLSGAGKEKMTLLTACPACQQGLNRYRDSTGLEVRYMVEELARARLGADWQQAFTDQVLRGGIERVLL